MKNAILYILNSEDHFDVNKTQIYVNNYILVYFIVCIRVSTPLKNTHLSELWQRKIFLLIDYFVIKYFRF